MAADPCLDVRVARPPPWVAALVRSNGGRSSLLGRAAANVVARGELLMLRGADVPRVMTWVELALNRRGRRAGDEPGGVLFVDGDLYSELGTSRLRGTADLAIEFHSGSARPVVGPTIRFAKRAVRRGL